MRFVHFCPGIIRIKPDFSVVRGLNEKRALFCPPWLDYYYLVIFKPFNRLCCQLFGSCLPTFKDMIPALLSYYILNTIKFKDHIPRYFGNLIFGHNMLNEFIINYPQIYARGNWVKLNFWLNEIKTLYCKHLKYF